MKKIFYIIFLIVAIFMAGCEKENNIAFEETQVPIAESNVTFSAAGGTNKIIVAESVISFEATSNEDWCQISKSGNTISVTVSQNINMLGRTALVTIKSGEKINFVPVFQQAVRLQLENYNNVTFKGSGETISIPYKCDVDASIKLVTDVSWLKATSSNGVISLTATKNPAFLTGRSAKVKFVAGSDLASVFLTVDQNELISSYQPDASVNSIETFLNLKNNGTSSRYKVVFYSPRLNDLFVNLKTAYPILQEIRIEAPRSSYKLSVILYNLNVDVPSFYYWNAKNGLVPVNDSKSLAVFEFSGNSYGGVAAPYTSNTYYTQLRDFFATEKGITIIPDGDAYWLRSEASPTDYVKVEPTSW